MSKDWGILTVNSFWLDPGDVARGASNSAEYEAECFKSWAEISVEDDEARAEMLVRAALIRLLRNTGWMSKSVRVGESLLYVHLTIEMDPDIESARTQRAEYLQEQIRDGKKRLIELIEQLEEAEKDGASA